MSRPLSDLDLARAHAEGALSPEVRAEVEARMRADPEFAALVSLYADVAGATDSPVPARPRRPAPDFEDAAPRPVALRPVALAAAAALVAGLGIALAWKARREPEPPPAAVVLRTISLEPVEVPEVEPVPAAGLARYSPNDGAGLRFVEGAAQGLAYARAAGKPLLLFLYTPACTSCLEVATGPLLEDAVAVAAEPFVVARQDVAEATPEVRAGLHHIPVFAVYGPDGERTTVFTPSLNVSDLTARIEHEAKVQAATHGTAPAWDRVRALASDLATAEGATDPARRVALWEKVAAEDPDGALGAQARSRLLAEREEARLALLRARDTASGSGPKEALATLDGAIARFRGTPYEADLRRVRDRLERTGAFPALETR